MKLTDALLGEHGIFYALFDHVEAVAADSGAVAQVQSAIAVLTALISSHAALEERLLFPALEAHLGKNGPLAQMRAEHMEMERVLTRIEDAGDIEEAAGWVEQALSLARSHFHKEELVIFRMAEQFLDEETQTQLGRVYAEHRRITIG